MKQRQASFLRSLFHINCCNSKRKNRQVSLQSRTVEMFDGHLDIRSFVSVHMNLAQLIWLLLSKEQRILFNHHRERSITQFKWRKDQSSSDSSDTAAEEASDSQKVPSLGLANSVPSKRAFSKLLGFSVKSEIDKKLLLGIFDTPKPLSNVSSKTRKLLEARSGMMNNSDGKFAQNNKIPVSSPYPEQRAQVSMKAGIKTSDAQLLQDQNSSFITNLDQSQSVIEVVTRQPQSPGPFAGLNLKAKRGPSKRLD